MRAQFLIFSRQRFITSVFLSFLFLLHSSCSLLPFQGERQLANESTYQFPPVLRFLPDDHIPLHQRHVHMMHVDGFHPDVFQKLLEAGKLPHFSFLLSRGKVSFKASTVDKSETLKVVPSYLTSQIDTKITGWWQFERDSFQFNNVWIGPKGVLDYNLGLAQPVYPTIYDYLVNQGERSTVGFALHRRGVNFNDYVRSYKEGIEGVFSHTYPHQAHMTMTRIRELYQRAAQSSEKFPKFSTSLLAPADEFAHLKGLTTERIPAPFFGDWVSYCLRRDSSHPEVYAPIFDLVEKSLAGEHPKVVYINEKLETQGVISQAKAGHFHQQERSFLLKKLQGLCYEIPVIDVEKEQEIINPGADRPKVRKVVHPDYVLGLLLVDMELGGLIHTLRSIRFNCEDGAKYCYKSEDVLELSQYIANQEPEVSLFEKTLFILLGDHGMIDTKNQMAACESNDESCYEYERSSQSINMNFIEILAQDSKLSTKKPDQQTASDELIAIDDALLPLELAKPYLFKNWQSPRIQYIVQQGQAWSFQFLNKVKSILKKNLGDRFWYLFLAKDLIVYPEFDKQITQYEEKIYNLLLDSYLKGEKEYVQAERKYLNQFYNQHVRLLYGGAARNNAEIFLPHLDESTKNYSWQKRPTADQIFTYRPHPEGPLLVETLLNNPGVGLMFVRQNNHLFDPSLPLPAQTDIIVMDPQHRQAMIRVWQDANTLEQVYGYKMITPEDPLAIEGASQEEWIFGTYNEWNERSIRAQGLYHNVVAGIGSYLHSYNTSIGDILLTQKTGWNFGSNSGGHGGVHSAEKHTVMLVSGPGISQGELFSQAQWKTVINDQGQVEIQPDSRQTYPTLLDMAPSSLTWLGHPSDALTQFARTEKFPRYLQQWIRSQRQDILNNLNNFDTVNQLLNDYRLKLDLMEIAPEVRRLLQFLPTQPPPLPNFSKSKQRGNLMILHDE